MAKIKQPEKDFEESDMREVKEDSKKRDKERGWDPENCKKDGKDMSHAIKDGEPHKKPMKLIYVKMADGSFRFSERPDVMPGARRPTTLPHSMLGKNEKVIGAGECETDKDGKITNMDNFSGHYQPGEKNLKETKKNAEEKGLAADGAKFNVRDKSGAVVKVL